MGLSFTIAAGPCQGSLSQVRVHILLSEILHSPNLDGQVPVFISRRNRMARFSFSSYDSQGYGPNYSWPGILVI
jgi:hypothetical protein